MPGLIEQLRAEAPARIEAVKNADTKAVQEKAKVAQEAVTAKFNEVLGAIDPKKLGETAQDLALRGVGVAAEYAVRAKETYDKVAEHGEQAVRSWRGDVADEIVDIAGAVEPEASEPQAATDSEPAAEPAEASTGAEEKPAGRKTTARRGTSGTGKKAAAASGGES